MFDCPVFPCTMKFSSLSELKQHLISAHRRSVRKHGLQELIDFAQHCEGWYFKEWRVVEK